MATFNAVIAVVVALLVLMVHGEIRRELFAVEISGGVDPSEVANAHGYEYAGPVHALPGIHVFRRYTDDEHPDEKRQNFPEISTSPHVAWFQPQEMTQREKRYTIPTDPLYSRQWHLHSHPNLDINVEPVWSELGVAGEGVTVGIVDDGLQFIHPDIAPNYNKEGSYDAFDNDFDVTPNPANDDTHGTPAAGLSSAARDSTCGVGSAFKSKVSGLRLVCGITSDVQEATALGYRPDINYIYSNSWGPPDRLLLIEGPRNLTTRAIERAMSTGRDGKGVIYVWACGNGRAHGDSCSFDGFASLKYMISIGAIDMASKLTYFSESCPAMMAVVGSEATNVITTDLLGNVGKSAGDCTERFGGTSAAAPIAAGVVALILSANPSLSWRDLQGVIIATCDEVDSSSPDWVTNGGGYRHSQKYGFGLLNAASAVALAQKWINLPAYETVALPIQYINKEIPPSGSFMGTLYVSDDIIVEHVEMPFKAKMKSRGNFGITLTSPAGTVSVFAEVRSDGKPDFPDWVFGSKRHWGELSAGKWSIEVTDKRGAGGATMEYWGLTLYGHKSGSTADFNPVRYVYQRTGIPLEKATGDAVSSTTTTEKATAPDTASAVSESSSSTTTTGGSDGGGGDVSASITTSVSTTQASSEETTTDASSATTTVVSDTSTPTPTTTTTATTSAAPPTETKTTTSAEVAPTTITDSFKASTIDTTSIASSSTSSSTTEATTEASIEATTGATTEATTAATITPSTTTTTAAATAANTESIVPSTTTTTTTTTTAATTATTTTTTTTTAAASTTHTNTKTSASSSTSSGGGGGSGGGNAASKNGGKTISSTTVESDIREHTIIKDNSEARAHTNATIAIFIPIVLGTAYYVYRKKHPREQLDLV